MFNRFREGIRNSFEAAANLGRRYWRRASSRALGLVLNPFIPLE